MKPAKNHFRNKFAKICSRETRNLTRRKFRVSVKFGPDGGWQIEKCGWINADDNYEMRMENIGYKIRKKGT